MKGPAPREIGYAFALPRLLARLGGREVRKAELSRIEAYGFGLLVFAMCCLFAGRALLPLVRPFPLQLLLALLLPFATWIAFLFLYAVNWLFVALLRRLGLYRAPTNNAFQHFVIMTLVTFFALLFLRDESVWFKSLGIFWLGLLLGNLLAGVLLKLRHES